MHEVYRRAGRATIFERFDERQRDKIKFEKTLPLGVKRELDTTFCGKGDRRRFWSLKGVRLSQTLSRVPTSAAYKMYTVLLLGAFFSWGMS